MCTDPFWYPIEFYAKDGKISGITSDLKRYFEEKIQINIDCKYLQTTGMNLLIYKR